MRNEYKCHKIYELVSFPRQRERLKTLASENFGEMKTLDNKYMLFAGWEVRIVKNCDRGLENAARGRRPRAAFSRSRSQFFTIRTDPKPVNNFFFFPTW